MSDRDMFCVGSFCNFPLHCELSRHVCFQFQLAVSEKCPPGAVLEWCIPVINWVIEAKSGKFR